MKKLLLSDLKEGMITAEDVYTIDKQLVVPKGTALTENLIAKLFSFDIFSVRISEAVITPKLSEDELSNLSASKRTENSLEYQLFAEDYQQKLDMVKLSFNTLLTEIDNFNPQEVLDVTMELISHRSTPTGIIDMMLNMRNYDDCTYAHSINVAMLCNILAGWLHFTEEEKTLATACGLFHDVGKMMIAPEIISKPAKLTESEYRRVQMHAIESYKILAKLDIPDEVRNAALMHHERCDGSGYPYGFASDKISKYAKIVAIADVYDAMTSKRPYKEAVSPFSVITHFENEGLSKYDPEFLLPFLENVVNTFVNQTVKLSNGLVGNIILVNPVKYSKPTVKIGDKYIDLNAVKDVNITDIL